MENRTDVRGVGWMDGWMDVRLYAVTDTELKGNTGLI